jgi:ATP-dependent helicase HrpB
MGELLALLAQHRRLVLSAPTGAGKSSRVGVALSAWLPARSGQVLVVQPRRLAARALAERVAQEQGWRLGAEVGYRVRFESRMSASTKLLFVTPGVALRWLQRDPFLEGVSALIFDEVHEQGAEADVALAFARQAQLESRPELYLLLMSATLETQRWSQYLDAAPVLETKGRQHALRIEYDPGGEGEELAERVNRAARRLFGESDGDLLAFLPGMREIRHCRRLASQWIDSESLHILHSSVSLEEQSSVLSPSPKRRLILASNIAESALTVPGVRTVIDSGWARVLRFDRAWGLERLELERISVSSAEQRAGRAAREGAGRCLRLWSPNVVLAGFQEPELSRVDPAPMLLQLLCWGVRDWASFPWPSAIDVGAWSEALVVLQRMNAVQGTQPTALGHWMALCPLHPRLARVLAEASSCPLGTCPVPPSSGGCLEDAARAVALLSEGAALEASEQLDLRAQIAAAFSKENPKRSWLERVVTQLLRTARDAPLDAAAQRLLLHGEARGLGREQRLGLALYSGLFDRLGRPRAEGKERGTALMSGDHGLACRALVSLPELFVVTGLELPRRGEQRHAWLRSYCPLDSSLVELSRRDEFVFDEQSEAVIGFRRVYASDLMLSESRGLVERSEAVTRCLAEAASQRLESAFDWQAAGVRSELGRLRLLARFREDLALPDLDEAWWRERLLRLCEGRASFAELRRLSVVGILDSELAPWRALLERLVPRKLRVPSGRELFLDYGQGETPVLSVKLQELFGCSQTPTVLEGRVPVLLHLLAPNGRPQQLTSDLESFWKNTYPALRRELRARYPKHPWPEDPYTALATWKTKPRSK